SANTFEENIITISIITEIRMTISFCKRSRSCSPILSSRLDTYFLSLYFYLLYLLSTHSTHLRANPASLELTRLHKSQHLERFVKRAEAPEHCGARAR
ncbi:MAG: hypothetical protein ABW298_03765, partial [Candidatus Binatia bacterium]